MLYFFGGTVLLILCNPCGLALVSSHSSLSSPISLGRYSRTGDWQVPRGSLVRGSMGEQAWSRVCGRWSDTCLLAHRSWHQSRTQPYSLFIGIGLEPGSTGVDLAPGSYEVGLEHGPTEVSLKPGILGVVWHQEPPGQTYSSCGSLKPQLQEMAWNLVCGNGLKGCLWPSLGR